MINYSVKELKETDIAIKIRNEEDIEKIIKMCMTNGILLLYRLDLLAYIKEKCREANYVAIIDKYRKFGYMNTRYVINIVTMKHLRICCFKILTIYDINY